MATPQTRRRLLLTAGVGVAGVLGAAAVASANSRRRVTLEVWGAPDPERRRDQLVAWAESKPNVKIHFVTDGGIGAGVQAQRRFAAAVAGRKAPDLVDFDRFQVAAFANWHLLEALDDRLRRDKLDLARYTPAVLEEAMGFDRKLYGLPSSVDCRLLYWNKEAFA